MKMPEVRHGGCRAVIAARRGWPASMILAGAAAWPHPALAQLRPIEAAVQATVTATNNGAGAPAGTESSDVIFSLTPRVHVDRSSAGLKLKGDAEVALLTSANKTRPDRALPAGSISADATLIERSLFLRSVVDVRQVEEDPFAARTDPSSPLNSTTSATVRIGPNFRHEVSPRVSVAASSDGTWTRYMGLRANDNRAWLSTARVDTKPMPFGGSIEVRDERVYYPNAADTDWTSRSIVAAASYAFSDDWIVGLLAGSERSQSTLASQTRSRQGFRIFWSPGPRTQLIGSAERRFFGNGFEAALRHRTVNTAFVLHAVREPTAGDGLRGPAAAGSRIDDFLDAILTTRIPDAAQRAEEVAQIVALRGLQVGVPGATGIAANYPQLRLAGNATWVALGTRHAVTLSYFAQRLTQLTFSDGTALVNLPAIGDSRQWGGSVGANRRLTPELAVDLEVRWSRIQGLGVRTGDETKERLYRVSMNQSLSPRASAVFGMTRRSVDARSATGASFSETSAFAALNQRF